MDPLAPSRSPLPPALARNLRLRTLAELETQREQGAVFATGWERFDAALGGGLPQGALSECSGPPGSCGLSLLQHQLLGAARARQQFVALIDSFDRFDPASSDPCLLESLLWVRGQGVPQAMKAADILVRDNNFSLILLDLREAGSRELRRVPAQQWYRLQRAAADNDSTLLAFTPYPVAVSARLRLRFGTWQRPSPDRPLDDLPRSSFAEGLTLSLKDQDRRPKPHPVGA